MPYDLGVIKRQRREAPIISTSTYGGNFVGFYSTGSNYYAIHVFTSSGQFTKPSYVTTDTAQVLVVAGGGPGATATAGGLGGGGGAGGVINSSTYSIASTLTIYVGAGGTVGVNGSASTVTNGVTVLVASGGGRGGAPTNGSGAAGGSGGGGSGTGTGGTSTSTQGNVGGGGGSQTSYAGGGGGASTAGGTANASAAGQGGSGTITLITGSPIWLAGGGGGGANATGYNNGSYGGGGAGGNTSIIAGIAGAANSGGGGGGGGGTAGVGGAGGGGIVIISYAIPANLYPSIQSDPYFSNNALLLNATSSTYVNSAVLTYSIFADQSTNGFAITNNGAVATTLTPFDPGSYHSLYFSGSNYLTVGSNNNYNFIHSTTAIITIEFWVYPISLTSAPFIFSNNAGNAVYLGAGIQITSSGNITFTISGGSTSYIVQATSSRTIPVNAWSHVAVTWNYAGNTGAFYINGNQSGTFVRSSGTGATGNSSLALIVGQSGSNGNFYNGYVSNLRLVNGTVVYTGNFIPSLEPLSTVQFAPSTNIVTITTGTTALLGRFLTTASTIADYSTLTNSISNVGSVTASTLNPFTSPVYESVSFNGSTQYLSATKSGGWLSSDHTLEAWIYINAFTSPAGCIAGEADGTGTGAWEWWIQSPNVMAIGYKTSSIVFISGTYSFELSTWYHVAVTRSGTTVRLFVNGTQIGSGTISGWTSQNVLNIGRNPLTAYPYYFNGYISNFRIVNGIAVYTGNFTAPTGPLQNTQVANPYGGSNTQAISTASLLTLRYATYGVNSISFIDYGTNNNSISPTGNPGQGTFSPFGNNWSTFFNGLTDYLSIPVIYSSSATLTALNFGTNNWTIETWAYLTANTGTAYIAGQFNTINTAPVGLSISANKPSLLLSNLAASSTPILTVTSPTALSTGTWNHIAAVRNDTRISIYVNGVEQAYSFSSNPTTDLSINTGTLASTNVTFSSLNPYDQSMYHSLYFDGLSYLNLPTNAGFNFGTGPVTIECWVYPITYVVGGATASETIDFFTYASGSYLSGQCQLQINSAGTVSFIYGTTVSAFLTITSTTVIPLNAWTHLAVVRSGTSLILYINGVNSAGGAASITVGQALGTNGAGMIGRQTNTNNYYFNGYISNVRIVKGTALYTASPFLVPQGPLSTIQNSTFQGAIANVTTNTTQLLVGRFVNPNRYFFDDYSSNNFTLNNVSVENPYLNGNAVGASPLYPPIASTSTFNSMSFYGYNYYLYSDTSSTFDISGGTWTIEFWMYATDAPIPTNEKSCIMVHVGQGRSNSINVVYNSTSSSISASMTVYAPTTPIGVSTVDGVISLNTWYHVAVVSNAGNASIYINGSQSGSTATITLPTSSQNFSVYIGHKVGEDAGTQGRFQGYMSNIRIVKGTAIYTGNFATPTAQLTNVPGTSLLIARSSSIIGEGIKQISTDFSLRPTTSTISGSTLSPSVFWPPIGSSTSTLYNSVNYISTGSVILYANSEFSSNSSFTVECWVWMNSLTTSTGGILSSCSILYGGFIIARDQVGIYTANAGTGTSITWTFPTNAWTHVALTCDRFLTISAYLNGVAVLGSPKTYTFGSVSTTKIGIGTRFYDGVPNFIGYISNVRFVNNHVVYTGNFTVPTGTLTATQLANPFGGSNTQAISTASYTKLLTILSTTVTNIVDYSTNTFAISIGSGTVSLSTLDPFSVYTATNYHSLYFNGNSSISVTSATGWLVHGDHTVEAWVNLNTTTYSNMLIAGTYNGVGTTGWEWSINNYYMTLGYRSAGALTTFVSTSTTQLFLPNTWNHVAFSRLGTTASMYVNGIRTTVTQIVSYTEQNTLRLGYFGFSTATSTYLTGYISNFRIVSGVAVYTGTNFVPPTGLLTTQQPPNPYAGTNTNAITFNTSTRILTAEFNGISIIPFNTTTNMLVGRAGSAVTSMFPGYLSNLRIVNGTAVYTSAFVPPSAPLPLITNTSLLVAASGYHVDKSTNNFIVTTGTIASLPNITKFTPYKIPGEYNKSIVGGSVYFNTSTAASQNLNIGTASTLALGSGNYTVECWVYAQSYNALNSALIDWRTNAGTTAGVPVLYMLAAGNIQWQNTGGTGFLTSPDRLSLNTWNHVAMVRYNSILHMYINGVVVASVADSTTLTIQTLFINSPITASNQTLFGFISNVRILVGRAIYTPTISVSTTTLTTVTNTVLLALQNDAPVLKDNSTNNFALTKPNTSTVFHQVLSPFGGQGSAYFNGSNNYLTVSTGTSLAFNFDVNDFTLEAWVYPTARNGYYGSLIIGPYSYPSVINWALMILSSGNLYIQLGSSSSLTSSSPVPLNQWSHVACVRNSGILTLYINGQIVGNISDVTTVTNTINVGIGAAINGSTATLFTGYITNLHVIKNYAKYTSAFTSPTDDITTVTNTSLLTLLSTDTTFIDRSLNSFAITTSTTATTFQSFSAYSTASWSTYFDGSSYVYISSSDPLVLSTSTNWTIETWVNPTGNYGVGDNVLFSKRSSGIIFQSMFFNGTSQYLSISTSTGAFAFGSNDWTIECWFYGYGAIIGRGPTDADDELYIGAGSNGQFFVDWGNASEYWQSATGLFSSNQWTHLAVVRSLSTLAVYQNGVSIGASAGTNIITRALTNNYAFRIGQARIGGAGSYFAGYIANLRVVNGIAVYTGNFNPPTGLLSTTEVANAFGGINTQAISVSTSTSLLIGQFNTSNSISDLSAYNSVVTNNNAVTVSLSGPTFYNSIQFNGANQYLTVPVGASTFGTGDFTVEAWFYKTAAITNSPLNNATGGTNVNYWAIGSYADGHYQFQIRDSSSQAFVTGSILTSLNTWVHVAVTRESGIVGLFINGVLDSSATITKTVTARTTNVGSFQFSAPYTDYFAGYISNVRLITGVAVYSTSTSFTVPTAPLSKYIPVGAGSAADSSSFSFVANAAVDFTTSTFATGTGDFTAECWVYMDPSSNAFAGFMTSVSSTVAGFIIARDLVGLFNANGAGLSHYFAWTVPGGIWTHVALTLRSGQLQAWLNGVSAGAAITRTDVTPAGTTIRLAGRYTSDTGYPFVGYISNARFVVGVGVYTGNFTVPTQQLQTTQPSGTNIQAITDARSVQLLTAQTNSITDFSTTATSVSVTGSVSTTTAYNPSLSAPTYSLILSSGYFYTPADAAFQFGTGDFTIECWFYYVGTAPPFSDLTQYTLISNLISFDNTTWDLQYYNGNWRFASYSPTFLQGSGSTLTGNTWYHIAVTRASGQGQIWLNGVSITGSVAFATNLSTTAQVRVGGNGISIYWNGYISNVRIVKGLALYSGTFTPPTSMLRSTQVGSGNIQSISTASLVSLLTGQSNAIIDNSKNNFSLTNGGAGIVNAITPFATSSTYDASYTTLLTANFIGTATSITDNSSNNYTITQTNNPPIDLLSPFGGLSYTTTSTSYQGYLSSGTGYLGFYNGTTYSSSTTALSTGTWNHVAYTYDGNVNPGKVNIYVNGFRVLQTTTNIISDTSENLHIGGVAGATENFYGYMSNFRIVKDSSLYLGSYFGVPSAKLNTTTDTLPYPLTSTISTSLLTLQDNRIVDKSINAHSLTVSGTPKTITFSPFAANPNISAYFNGTSDFINVAAQTALSLGVGDFNIEVWVYPTAVPTSYAPVLDARTSTASVPWIVGMQTVGGVLKPYFYDGTTRNGATTIQLNVWTHLAYSRTNSILRMFVNGAIDYTSPNNVTNMLAQGTNQFIGKMWDGTGNMFQGYMSNLRVVNGRSLYTGNFNPSQIPLAQAAGGTTNLLATFVDGRSINYSGNSVVKANTSSVTLSTSPTKYNNYSLTFNGTNDFLTVSSSTVNVYNSNDFTWEMWVYPTSPIWATTSTYLVDYIGGQGGLRYVTNKLSYYNATTATSTSSFTLSINSSTWTHLAVSRATGVTSVFVNGAFVVSTPDLYNFTSQSLIIGNTSTTAVNYFQGYIEDLRITKGVARYTSSFVPPTKLSNR